MAMAPGGMERRRTPRIWVNFQTVLTWNGKKIHCSARQLSEVGILLATTHKEMIGENIQLELMLESPNTALSLLGMVVNVLSNGIGIRFRDMSPEQQNVLRTYLGVHGIGMVKS